MFNKNKEKNNKIIKKEETDFPKEDKKSGMLY